MHSAMLRPSVGANRKGVVGRNWIAVVISVQIDKIVLIVHQMVGAHGQIIAKLVIVSLDP